MAAAGSSTPGAATESKLQQRRRQRLEALSTEAARFRELIGKVGSGQHTSTGLSREEAREAMELMLGGDLPPAQLGAFLIAHRIRRPGPLELAGLLDAYRHLGPRLLTAGRSALCFGVPYDGRLRSAPLLPLVALTLAEPDRPVVLHGGDPMPVKYGLTLAEQFAALGIRWQGLSLERVQQRLDRHGLALTHQPDHFPAAERLVAIRDLIGKRPPLATLELLWTPHQGAHRLISGFVHPPTEALAREALAATGESDVLLIKGLEGSTDLPASRTSLLVRIRGSGSERLSLNPRDHGLDAADCNLDDLDRWRQQALAALRGEGPLAEALAWNLAIQLWLDGRHPDLPAALIGARALLQEARGEALRQALMG